MMQDESLPNLKDAEKDYYPLADTLRLYAGWLTAILFVVYALGSYQQMRNLPFGIALLDNWIESPMLLRVTFVCFLYLALGSLHRAMGRGIWKGIMLTIVGFIVLAGFMANT